MNKHKICSGVVVEDRCIGSNGGGGVVAVVVVLERYSVGGKV